MMLSVAVVQLLLPFLRTRSSSLAYVLFFCVAMEGGADGKLGREFVKDYSVVHVWRVIDVLWKRLQGYVRIVAWHYGLFCGSWIRIGRICLLLE